MKQIILAICSLFITTLRASEPIQLDDSELALLSNASGIIFSENIAIVPPVGASDRIDVVIDEARYVVANKTLANTNQFRLQVINKKSNIGYFISISSITGDRLLKVGVLNDSDLLIRIGAENKSTWRSILVNIQEKKLRYLKNYVDGENLPVISHNNLVAP